MTINSSVHDSNSILVTVIVPVYNVFPYLNKCVDSLLAQTHSNLQIILVDDGSTDGSEKKCDVYAAQDSRITVIHKENAGPSDARNAGLDIMKGDYLTFVDSDDEVVPQYVEQLLAFATDEDLDLAIASYSKIGAQAPTESFHDAVPTEPSRTLLTRQETMLRMLYRQELSMYSHGKLYRSALFDNIRFPYGKLFEDVTTTWEIVKIVSRVGYLDAQLYLYRQRDGSIVHDEFSAPKMEEVYTHKKIMKDVEEHDDLHSAAVSKFFFCLLDLYAQTDAAHAKERKYLKMGIKAYRYRVLTNRNNDISIRMMALLSYFPHSIVRCVGRFYKKKQQIKCNE